MQYNIIILEYHAKSFYDIDIAEIGTDIGYTLRFDKNQELMKINDDSEDNIIKLIYKYGGKNITSQYRVLYSFMYDTTKVMKQTFYKVCGLEKISLPMAKVITRLLKCLCRKKDLKIAMDELYKDYSEKNNLGSV